MTSRTKTRATGEGDARQRENAQFSHAAPYKNSTTPDNLEASAVPEARVRKAVQASQSGSEHHLQAAVAEYLTLALPLHDAVFCAIPNGGKRDKGTAGKLKGRRGRLSSAQLAFSMRWTTAGGVYAVARSLGEVAALLDAAGMPLRARLGGAT